MADFILTCVILNKVKIYSIINSRHTLKKKKGGKKEKKKEAFLPRVEELASTCLT